MGEQAHLFQKGIRVILLPIGGKSQFGVIHTVGSPDPHRTGILNQGRCDLHDQGAGQLAFSRDDLFPSETDGEGELLSQHDITE